MAAPASLQLDVVNHRAHRDVLDRQRVADLGLSIWPRHHPIAHLQAHRRQDVALLAVGVDNQGDARRPVRVILNRIDPPRHTKLVALEIDDAIGLLVTATLVANGQSSLDVAPTATCAGR